LHNRYLNLDYSLQCETRRTREGDIDDFSH
jgi:hypothetical protein